MFDIEFLKQYPEFTTNEGLPLTNLPPRMRPKPLDAVIRDYDELVGKLKVEKKKPPESPEAVIFARAFLEPLVWFEVKIGDVNVPIVDASPLHYPEAIEILEEHFMVQEPLCKAMRLKEDINGINDLVHQICSYMDSSTSLFAMDTVHSKPIGLLIGQVDDVEDCTEKAHQKHVFSSKRLQTIFNFSTFMIKTVNMHERYNCKTYYRVYMIAVHKNWQNKGVEKALITGALKMCHVMKIPILGGLFTMYKDQYYMKQFKAKVEFEVYYSEWRTSRGLRIFRGTGKTEPKVAFMSLTVPDFEPSSVDAITTPLTSQRGTRFIKKRLSVWNELDIFRACQCGLKPEEIKRPRKARKMKIIRRKEDTEEDSKQQLKPLSSTDIR